ncbi:transposase [Hymenobacter terrenus]|uniref:transposase n=1 Tax=Hymenobacter terrenus TaxID=1629124 RepID=UPI0006192927|nr:transposase [Hymenobacter terrenus]
MDRRWQLAAGQRLFNGGGTRADKNNAPPPAAILDRQRVKNTATSTRLVGYDAGKCSKGRKRFFLVNTLGKLLACCVVAAHCHDGATAARVWDALALDNKLLDRLHTVFVDGGFVRRFRQHVAGRGVQAHVPRGVVADNGRFFSHAKALGGGTPHCLGWYESPLGKRL